MKLPFAHLRYPYRTMLGLDWPPDAKITLYPEEAISSTVDDHIMLACRRSVAHGYNSGPLTIADCITQVMPQMMWLSYRPRLTP